MLTIIFYKYASSERSFLLKKQTDGVSPALGANTGALVACLRISTSLLLLGIWVNEKLWKRLRCVTSLNFALSHFYNLSLLYSKILSIASFFSQFDILLYRKKWHKIWIDSLLSIHESHLHISEKCWKGRNQGCRCHLKLQREIARMYNVTGSLTRRVEELSRAGKALILYIHINNPFTRSRE